MRGKDVKKHVLDHTKTIDYFVDSISSGKLLAQEILSRVNFEKGNFFTILYTSADLSKVYSLSGGTILPAFPHGKPVYLEGCSEPYQPLMRLTMDEACSEFVHSFLSESRQNSAIFESFLEEATDPHVGIKNVPMLTKEKEVYYRLDFRNSEEEVYDALRRTQLAWHFLGILTQGKQLHTTIHTDDCESLIQKCKFIITTAYDGEGYLFWEPKPPE